MASYILDTNILILALRGAPDALDYLEQLNTNEHQVYISVVTRTEIFAGMRPHEEQMTVALLTSFNNLPVNEAIAERAGRWIYHYARNGVQLSFPDSQIAATALEYNLTLVTTNAKHFPMPELKLHPFQ